MDPLTERESAAGNHDRYAHADGGIGVESVWRLYKHHDKSCGDDSKVIQDISKDMNDDSIDSQITVCMLFRWVLLLRSAHCRAPMNLNMTYKIRHLENWSACLWLLARIVMVMAVI
jgi:hypothetical protein